MIKVLVVDDQHMMRDALVLALNGRDDISVVGEASSGTAAVAAAERLRPDVVLMDLRMPAGDGIAATRALTERTPPVKVLAITSFDLNEEVFGALRAGATSLILKDSSPDALVDAVRITARDESILTPAVLRRVLKEVAPRLPAPSTDAPPVSLKPRDREILRALADGKSNREIAKELSITQGSLKNIISRMAARHHLTGRTHLAAWALRNGHIS